MPIRSEPHHWDDSRAYSVQVASRTHNGSRKRMSVLEKHNNELEELKSKRQALKNLSTNTTQLQTNQGLKIGLKKNNSSVKASTTKSKVVITVNKPYMESRLGLGIDPFGSSIKIRNMKHDSLFRGSALKVGDTLDSINGIKYASFKMGKLLLQAAPAGPLTVVAVSTDADDNCVAPLQVTAAAQREATLPVMQHVGEKHKKSPENSNLMQFPWPIELPSTGVVALRGRISTKHNVQMFKGEWAFGLDIITGKTEGLTEPFEYQMGLPVSGGGITFDGKFQYSGKDINDKFVLNCTQNRGGYWNVFGKGGNKFGDFCLEGSLKDGELTLGRTYVVVDTSTPPVSSLQERSLRSRNIPLGSPSSSKFERVAVLCCGLISLSLTMSLLDCEAAEEEVSAATSSNLTVDKENLAQVRNK